MLALLWSMGCETPEVIPEGPPPPPAEMSTDPPLDQITDARGWLTKQASLKLVGPAGERTVPLIPPIRIIDVRATAWHLFLFAERKEPGTSSRGPSTFNLEITDLASGTTCGTELPAATREATTDVVRGEHLLFRAALTDGTTQARLFDVECKELVNVKAQVVEVSPDKAFLATYPGPNATAADEPVVRLFDLGVGIQLGSSYPIVPPARVGVVTWRKQDVQFALVGDRDLDPIRVLLPP